MSSSSHCPLHEALGRIAMVWDRDEFKVLRDVVFAVVAANTAYQFGDSIYRRGVTAALSDIKQSISILVFKWLKSIPMAREAITKEIEGALRGIEKDVLPAHDLPCFTRLPTKGLSLKEIESLLKHHQEQLDLTGDVSQGHVSGAVYSMDEHLKKAAMAAYNRFIYSNPLHPDIFRAGRKMEAEVVAMTLAMFHGVDGCVGAVTSGGTESILLAMLAYRQQARMEKGVLFPEIIAPITAHAAFDKAAAYFGIRLVHAPVDAATGIVDVNAMRRLITKNTICLIGSTPCFSLGTIDDIQAIASLSTEFGIGCHVDCCLGSFLAPQIAEQEGLSPFDFRVPGVTSISCDTHKYGFTPKGTSVIMYRDASLRSYQYFVTATWTGGIYASPTLAGSRPGSVVAATWASLLAAGEETYRNAALHIRSLVKCLVQRIQTEFHADDLHVIGQPGTSVVAFGSKTLNVYAINDQMTKRGWHLNALQNPSAFHLALTMLSTMYTINTFICDLHNSIAHAQAHPEDSKHGTAGIYGTSASLPDKSIIEDVARGYIDILYRY